MLISNVMKTIIEPPNFKNNKFKAFFTTKVTSGIKEFFKSSEYNEKNIYMPVQKHTDKVIIIKNNIVPEIADAVLTAKRGIIIGVQTADCIPIILADTRKIVAGAVHAGWKGTAASIIRKTIEIMISEFKSQPEDIIIAMGPSIKGCCYQVDKDVETAIYNSTGSGGYIDKKNGKYYIDLPEANKIQILSTGIPDKNIWISGECTFCNHDKYHSFRYHGNHAGRQGGFIGILNESL